MVIEIDAGIWIESNDLSSVALRPSGEVIIIAGGVAFNVSRFSFEQMLQMLRDRDYADNQPAY